MDIVTSLKITPWPEIQDLLPPLGIPERESLRLSIETEGVKQPILVLPDGRIIDGHHRWEFANGDAPHAVLEISEDKAFDLAVELNLARRQLSRQQIKRIKDKQEERRQARREKALELRQNGATQQEAASAVGVSRQAVDLWENITIASNEDASNSYILAPDSRVIIPRNEHPTIFDRLKEGETQNQIAADYQVTQPTISRIKRQEEARQEKERKRAEAAERGKTIDLPNGVAVWTGDFRVKSKDIPDESVDLIFTDPPYDRKSVPLYGDMAQIAKRILKPGGSLLTYAGHYVVPDILDLMRPHLNFWWIIAIQHGGGSQHHKMMYQKGITVGWKPILWFVKGDRRFDEFVSDWIESVRPDKILHDWEQDLTEAAYYIEHLTRGGELVLDPFVGSGTTLVAALGLTRKAIGIEVDADRANVARSRIGDYARSRTA
jgi:transcriptional regulator with XRE-family HTH domain